MFACVQYTEDKERAVLPVELVRDFRPRSPDDFKKDNVVMAYWADEDGGGESFYPANVTALADSLEGLVTKLKTSRSSFPRVILGKLSKGNLADEGLSKREQRKRKREASRKELGQILKAFKQSENTELFEDLDEESKDSSSVQDLHKERTAAEEIEWKVMVKKIEELEKELQKKEDEKEELARLLDEERERSRRLTDALLNKIEIAPTAQTATEQVPAIREILVPAISSGDPLQPYEVLAEGSNEGDSMYSHVLENALEALEGTDQADMDDSFVAASSPAPQEPNLFEVVDGNVHLGPGISIPEIKLAFIMKAGHEMKVAREMARFFWTTSELKIRCLTGQPSRRTPDSVAKQQATPNKVTAIMNVVEKIIAEKASDVPGGKRRGQARKAIRDLFAETARLGQRTKSAV